MSEKEKNLVERSRTLEKLRTKRAEAAKKVEDLDNDIGAVTEQIRELIAMPPQQ